MDILTGDRSFGISHELGGLMPPPSTSSLGPPHAHPLSGPGGGASGLSTSSALHAQASGGASGGLSASGELLAPPQPATAAGAGPGAAAALPAAQQGVSLDGDLSQSNKSLSGERAALCFAALLNHAHV